MRKPIAALVVALALASLAAAELRITGETKVKRDRMVKLKAEGDDAKTAGFIWDVFPTPADSEEEPDGRLRFTGPPGTYVVKMRAVNFEAKRIVTATTIVTVEADGPVPPPVPPVPPGPTPPVPPAPVPPGPIANLKVLIVEESADSPKLPAAQKAILYGAAFRAFLDGKCTHDPETQTKKAWRIADKDQDLRMVDKFYQDAQASAKTKPMPRIVIGSDAGIAYDGPLPATVAEAQALVNKFAGPPAKRKAG